MDKNQVTEDMRYIQCSDKFMHLTMNNQDMGNYYSVWPIFWVFTHKDPYTDQQLLAIPYIGRPLSLLTASLSDKGSY